MNTYDIWKRGAYLANAWLHFASPDQKIKFQQLSETQNSVACIQRLFEEINRRKDEGAELHNALLNLPTDDFSILPDQIAELKNQVLHWVKRGILLAYGFEQPRKSSDSPVCLPDDIWNGKINWNKSEVSSGSLIIESVRLIFHEHAKRHQTIEHKKKPKPGRPSRRPEVIDAYHALRDRGQIDYAKSLGNHYIAIRHQVVSVNPNDPAREKGLGNEAIRRALRTLFEEDQSQHL